MASILKVDSIGKTSGSTQDTMGGLTKVWFHFNGQDNSYRDSFNITDVTDNGTGDFTHNFTNNMNNDDFSFTTGTNGNSNEGVNSYNMYYDPDTVASSSVTSRNISSGGTAQDSRYIMGMVAGDLAQWH